ncbi:hypothetical protein QQ045_005167 [Rhodiola kirilowii]
MAEEGPYNEDQVDLDDCLEELVCDIEEQLESDKDDTMEFNKTEETATEEIPDTEVSPTDPETAKDELKPCNRNSERRAALLAYPPHGCEVFIAGLPKNVSEVDLDQLCESIGEIFEVRVVKNKGTCEAKGCAFVSFTKKEDAKKAVEHLHNQAFMGKTLRCSLSESKYRLFIGNIPNSLTQNDFRKVIEEIGPGSELIDLVKDPQKPGCNRGFGFVEYYNSACAEYAKEKMSSTDFQIEGTNLSVSWADTKSKQDNSALAQVKALYVKNIPDDITIEQLKELFQRHGEVTKVVMPPPKSGDSNKRNFGFVHYSERSSALKAVTDSETYEIKGKLLEVNLAKPQSDKKPNGQVLYGSGLYSNHRNSCATYPYGSAGAEYGISSGFRQPMTYGKGQGAMPAGMQMAPMVLPDGQIGYVLQQQLGAHNPNQRPQRNDQRSGHRRRRRSSDRRDDDDGGGHRSRRHRPY